MSERLRIFYSVLKPLPTGRFLDLGCGHGAFSLVAAHLGWKVTAVDARTKRMPDYDGIRWVESDVRTFPIEPNAYDVIAILGLLYHMELDAQLDLLRRCSGAVTIVDTHVALKPEREERGYSGLMFDEVAGRSDRQFRASGTASWGNKQSFWPTEPSLLQMFKDSGYAWVTRLSPSYDYDFQLPYEHDRTFYICYPDYSIPSKLHVAEVERHR